MVVIFFMEIMSGVASKKCMGIKISLRVWWWLQLLLLKKWRNKERRQKKDGQAWGLEGAYAKTGERWERRLGNFACVSWPFCIGDDGTVLFIARRGYLSTSSDRLHKLRLHGAFDASPLKQAAYLAFDLVVWNACWKRPFYWLYRICYLLRRGMDKHNIPNCMTMPCLTGTKVNWTSASESKESVHPHLASAPTISWVGTWDSMELTTCLK
jgi:hypothetical protein